MLKYVNTGVVFQEIPDEVTLAINISNADVLVVTLRIYGVILEHY